jgi:hypothetical protein
MKNDLGPPAVCLPPIPVSRRGPSSWVRRHNPSTTFLLGLAISASSYSGRGEREREGEGETVQGNASQGGAELTQAHATTGYFQAHLMQVICPHIVKMDPKLEARG